MSWFWGSKEESKDSTRDLDPSLKAFLDKETARQQAELQSTPKPQPSPEQRPTTQASNAYRTQFGLQIPGVHHEDQNQPSVEVDRPLVPEKSQFQDGRYADLWKTYRSPEELAAVSQTDQDKLTAITKNFKDRKAAIGRAAIENCVLEQLAQQECWTSGSLVQLSTMCRAESKAFNRCYNMQARFLKALGYLSAQRSVEEEERIQAHADKLYQNMLKREQEIKEAKERGIEPEPTKPLIVADDTVKALGPDSAWAKMREDAVVRGDQFSVSGNFTKEQQAKIMDGLKDMSDEEKALELQLLAAETRVRRDMSLQMKKYWDEEREARRKRREEGQETMSDKLKRIGGWQT